MKTTNKATIKDVIKIAKQTGVSVSNIDLPAIISYINEYEQMTSFGILYNHKEFGKTVIIKK